MLKTEMETQKARYQILIPALEAEIKAGEKPGVDKASLEDYAKQLKWMKDSPVNDEAIAKELGEIDLHALNEGDALNMVGMIIRHKYYLDHNIVFEKDGEISGAAHACFTGFDTLDIPQVTDAYRPRPLGGVWASPPFLHNGSIPNLYELLSPWKDRSKGFYVGQRDFDPKNVGYVTERTDGSTQGFWLDTSKQGNLNTGHQFAGDGSRGNPDTPEGRGIIGRGFTPEERYQIIEYLKIHNDSPDEPARTPPDCLALVKAK